MTQRTNTTAGTANFLSPQACDGKFNEASDIWAYGMILYEIVRKGKVPLSGMGDVQIWRYIEGRKMPDMADIKSYFTDELKDVMVKCLEYEFLLIVRPFSGIRDVRILSKVILSAVNLLP